jgi:hypothetical protein
MEKLIARAALALVLTGSLLAAPATIKVVKDPAGLPQPFSRMARAGDLFVSDGKFAALIAAIPRTAWSSINYGHPDLSGYVAAFLPSGAAARPDIQLAYPSIRLNGKALAITASSVRAEANAGVARASSHGPEGLSLDVVVRYTFAFDSGRIDAAAEIRNAGTAEIKGLSFSLGATPWQSYSFSPFNAKAFPSLNFRVYERPDHALAWYNPNPVETSRAPLPGSLRPGAAHRLSYSVFAASALPDLLARLYRAVRLPTVRAGLELKKFDGPAEVIVREPATGAVFFRTFLDKPAPLAFPLPPGTYEVRANLFPAVVEKTFVASADKGATANAWTIEAPAFGRVRVAVADRKGRHVPGKVTFIGLAPTATPYFLPENPVATARSWETLKNAVYPTADDLEVKLPTGTYLASASHGPEYAMETRIIEVLSRGPQDLRFTVDRALATPGLVSVDTHMHTQFSDGSVLVPLRLRSAVAEGVDVVVSADHNTVTDYGPDLDRLGLAGELAFIPGAEVTARTGSIHFNTFPVAFRAGEPGNGSIAVLDETPAALFAAARRKNAGSLIHLNHPRSGGLGYFNAYDLDPDKAAFAAAPFDPGFDVMEAMNGATFGGDNRRAIDDWFHLLNRGYPIRIVGSSDAHGVDGGETGYARTFVLMAEPAAGPIDREALVAAIRKGRSFVSNGPVIAARANRKATFGDMVTAKKGRVDVDITVTGAPWLDVSEVRLIVNGERRPPLVITGADGRTIKFRDRVRVETPRDGWIAVEVLGSRSLYPLIQQRSGDGTAGEAALPYALTNPIVIDADGDGRSDPVWPEKVILK